MKSFHQASKLSLLMIILAIAALACQSSKDNEVRDEARESLGLEESSEVSTTPPPTATVPPPTGTAAAAGGVQHYICPDGCEGSGGPSAGTCPVCGKDYVHNQAWHAQNNNQTTQPTIQPAGSTPPTNATPPPAQNAAGVYHYTCPNGCAGGAASAGTCSSCGAALAHNSAYHQ